MTNETTVGVSDQPTAEEHPARPKQPMLAAVLSALCPGLGQWYAGRFLSGLLFMLVTAGGVLALLAYLLNPATPVHPALAAVPVALLIIVVVSTVVAYRAAWAWNTKHKVALRETPLLGKLVFGITVTALSLLSPSVTGPLLWKASTFDTYTMETTSMRPSIQLGDRLLVDKRAYAGSDPGRGDLVVFRHPQHPKRTSVKRVAGLPGEIVDLRYGRLMIDGTTPKEPEKIGQIHYFAEGNYGSEAVTVAESHFYLLGDNTASSDDSRFWGPVPRKNIIGRAYKIYFPFERSGPID